MPIQGPNPRLLSRSCSVRPLALALFLGAAGALSAATIAIPNSSFEQEVVPPGSPVSINFPPWTANPNPGFLPPEDWAVLTGVFPNTDASQYNTITNISGNQAVYVTAIGGAGFYQDLSSPDAVFAVGQAYQFTLAIRAGEFRQNGQPVRYLSTGDTLHLVFYYRDGSNNIVPIKTSNIVFDSATMPYSNFLTDYSVTTDEVNAGDLWAGKAIGLMVIVDMATFNGTGGYWDMDNARLASVPEPSAAGLLLVGLASAGLLRRRSAKPVFA